jgi:hypothetical protein
VIKLSVDRFTFPIATHVVADDLMAPREKCELVTPLAAVGYAGMNHHQGYALTGCLII